MCIEAVISFEMLLQICAEGIVILQVTYLERSVRNAQVTGVLLLLGSGLLDLEVGKGQVLEQILLPVAVIRQG